MDRVIRDVRWALRGLSRSPGFTLATVITLAVGIGANSAVFSLVNGVLIKPLPFPDAEQLIVFRHTAPGIGLPRLPLSGFDYVAYREVVRNVTGFGVFATLEVDLSGEGEPERLAAAQTAGGFFTALGTPPELGRTLHVDDEAPSATPVVVLSRGLWERRYGSDPEVIGRTIRLDGVSREIVGVMPRQFTYPSEGTAVWLPATIEPLAPTQGHIFEGVARIRPGLGLADARADFEAGINSLPEVFPESWDRAFIERGQFAPVIEPLKGALVGDVSASLWILMGTVAFVLLIACANVANLFLVRVEGRQQDRAVREALGASRMDQMRAELAESGVLAMGGGLTGLALGMIALPLIARSAPATLPRMDEIGLDLNVVVFTAGITILSALVFAFIPMARHGRSPLSAILGEGGIGLTGTRWRQRVRGGLVVGQVAIALVLLVGAGLLVRNFSSMLAVDPNFDVEGVFTARLNLPLGSYPTEEEVAAFYQRLIDATSTLPGVQAVSAVSRVPLGSEAIAGYGFQLEDYPPAPGDPPTRTNAKVVAPGYFETMGIELLEGRGIDRDDHTTLTNAIVINHVMAERFWAGQSALGRRIRHGPSGDWLTIVGVVEAVLDRSLTDQPESLAYLPMVDTPGAFTTGARGMTLVARTAGNPDALRDLVVGLVKSMDQDLPVVELRTLDDVMKSSWTRMSFTMTVFGIAAGMALLLGSVGLYGVIAYIVSQRTREIGVRIALGAQASRVHRLVLRQGMTPALAGVALGLVGAVGVSRFLEAFLFEVEPVDPLTYGAVALLLLAVAWLACYWPARRASRVDPLVAIRME